MWASRLFDKIQMQTKIKDIKQEKNVDSVCLVYGLKIIQFHGKTLNSNLKEKLVNRDNLDTYAAHLSSKNQCM